MKVMKVKLSSPFITPELKLGGIEKNCFCTQQEEI